jgi:hypothetical protein
MKRSFRNRLYYVAVETVAVIEKPPYLYSGTDVISKQLEVSINTLDFSREHSRQQLIHVVQIRLYQFLVAKQPIQNSHAATGVKSEGETIFFMELTWLYSS